MKKLYIVTAYALCAVLSVEAAGGCKSGKCGVRKPTVKMPVIYGPVPRPVVVAPAKSATASWYASRITQGSTESSAKIKKDIEASIAATEKKLKSYRAQRQKLSHAGKSTASIGELNKKITAAESELNTLRRMLSCVK